MTERRKTAQLNEEQIEDIAERAAAKAIEKLTERVYHEVGKSVISKLLYIVGSVALGVYFWFQGHWPLK